jgi:hypothetical protein
MQLGVLRNHEGNFERIKTLSFHRNADQPTGVLHHESDRSSRYRVRCHDDVAFILPVLVIDDDDYAAARQCRDCSSIFEIAIPFAFQG